MDPLNPSGIYVTDNFSTDKTIEILRKYPKVRVTQYKCRRGKGREMALKEILKVARPEDCVMYVDFDAIMKKPFIDLVKRKMTTIKHKEIYVDLGSLSTAKTNQDLPWPPLNASEDTERLANAIKKGIKVYKIKGSLDKYFDPDLLPAGDMKAAREARFESNPIGKYVRLFRHLIDDERGMAIKSFSGFYSLSKVKSPVTFTAYLSSYIVARAMGLYVHDKQLNNSEIVNRGAIYIKG